MSPSQLPQQDRIPMRLRSIGEVIAELKPEFSDLSPSKLRFLEAEGLVTPARLANGYRKYTDTHIRRLRVVLTLQRDQYLPLKVIREKLADYDAGVDVLGTEPAIDEAPLAEPETLEQLSQEVPDDLRGRLVKFAEDVFAPAASKTTYGREELLSQSGLTRSALAEIEDLRLIETMPSGRYDEEALTIATLVARLAERGIEVRHIKPTRYSVDRERGLVENVLAAQRKRRGSGDPRGQEDLAEAQREIAGGLLALHAMVLRTELRHL